MVCGNCIPKTISFDVIPGSEALAGSAVSTRDAASMVENIDDVFLIFTTSHSFSNFSITAMLCRDSQTRTGLNWT